MGDGRMTTINGLEPLLELRKAGKLPGRDVILWIDKKPYQWARYKDAMTMPEGMINKRDDMRVLLRLDVVLVADRFTADVSDILEKVKQVANSIIFISLSADDLLVWNRGADK